MKSTPFLLCVALASGLVALAVAQPRPELTSPGFEPAAHLAPEIRQEPTPVSRAVLVPGTRVKLEPPAGHAPGRGFLGYQWPETGASLLIFEIPGAYAEVAKDFDEKGLAKAGMKLLESSSVKISGRDARLLLVRQESQDVIFHKWVAVLGDEKRTVLLNAIFPEDLEGELPALMKAAVLAAEWDPKLEVDPFAPLPWTLTCPEGLRFAGNMGTTLFYSEDGEVVQKEKPTSARFTVSPSMGEVTVGDARKFAEKRIRQLPIGKGLEIESSQAFEVAGRKGWEIVATAQHEKKSVDLLVHQVLIVGEGEYQLLVAQCGLERRETWLPRFRASAASWKLKEVPRIEAK